LHLLYRGGVPSAIGVAGVPQACLCVGVGEPPSPLGLWGSMTAQLMLSIMPITHKSEIADRKHVVVVVGFVGSVGVAVGKVDHPCARILVCG
jgi:hypothetical protein